MQDTPPPLAPILPLFNRAKDLFLPTLRRLLASDDGFLAQNEFKSNKKGREGEAMIMTVDFLIHLIQGGGCRRSPNRGQ